MTTTPKPGPASHPPENSGVSELNHKIDELENLIADKAAPSPPAEFGPAIPVLDEIVNADDFMLDEEEPDLPGEPHPGSEFPENNFSQERVQQLIGNVEEKLAEELDALVSILKDAIKDSIMTEIKSQLEPKGDAGASPKPGGKPPV